MSDCNAYIPTADLPVNGGFNPDRAESDADLGAFVPKASSAPAEASYSASESALLTPRWAVGTIVVGGETQFGNDPSQSPETTPTTATSQRTGEIVADEETDGEASAGEPHATLILREYFASRHIRVLFDGSLVVTSAPKMAYDYNDVPAFLMRSEPTIVAVLDELVLRYGRQIKKSELESALRREIEQRQQERLAYVLGRLIVEPSSDPQYHAENEWRRLSAVFDLSSPLSIAILKHFVWQVKRKALRKPVAYHLMPILFSPMQGTGKTTFAQRFLAPLEELASDPVTLSDFADPRSGDIYRYPAVLIDDVDTITDRQVSVLKSVITAKKIRRRRLGTSLSVVYQQSATLFGTANKNISYLVVDDTGHRRFAMLPFRNGAVERGGDQSVWQIINSINYLTLWRSINPFNEKGPIEPHLDELAQHQGVARPDAVREWLLGLDIKSEAFRAVQERAGVQARNLFDLMCAQTEIEITEAEFGRRMRHLLRDPEVPFDQKVRKERGYYYQLRKTPV